MQKEDNNLKVTHFTLFYIESKLLFLFLLSLSVLVGRGWRMGVVGWVERTGEVGRREGEVALVHDASKLYRCSMII